ncbi:MULTISPECIES: OprD family porin [Pseudomonas]|uniref:OprD family porin n=1 Tax=Pseudomonas quercus TaxID=2722792 RepID=A0ABX0YHE6_9PSED|nr:MULTISPECIES: OprD family porin [Pseudomonas]MBF7144327.1 OprD family porin [Pseudomonas sp. LY10J]NJP02866.1 OprD family porin [Pseudomonas quercus]
MTIKNTATLSALAAIGAGLCLPSLAYADFIKDSKATLAMRNFYFNNDYRDQTPSAGSKIAEWGQGFVLDYKSGFTDGTVGFGLDAQALLGLTLDSGAGRHQGSTMIPSESNGDADDSWTRAGVTGKMRFSKTEVRYGNLQPKLPILVSNDGRLLPQTFQGGMITSNEIDHLKLVAGRLEQVVGRASTNRTGMGVANSTQDSNEFWFGGGDYTVNDQLTLQYYYANLEDFYKQHFAGLVHVYPISKDSSFKTDLRYFKTDADGENDSAAGRLAGYKTGGYSNGTNGKIDNDTWSAIFTYSLGGHSFTGGYQSVSDNSNFVQLNQGGLVNDRRVSEGAGGASLYLFTDRLIGQFTRAGEQTRFAQYAYNFSEVGVPGLTASVTYLKGTGIEAVTGGDTKEWERDVAVDYVVQGGTFKGVGFGWRNGMFRTGAASDYDQDQNRLIVSYTLPLL